MSNVRSTRAFFTSQNANNSAGRFEFSLREPIFNVRSIKIKKIVIGDFVGMANSSYYFLRTDCVTLIRDTATMNGFPTQIAAMIANTPSTVGYPIELKEDDDSELYNSTFALHTLWFELLDQNLNVLNPPDAGWSFCIELKILTNAAAAF